MDAGLVVSPWDELADTPPRREEESRTKPTEDGVATKSF